MSEMVDRVARAIGVADLNASAKSMPNVPMETMAEYVKHAADEGHYEAMARAAIEAMIEPTEAMLDAPYHAEIDFGPGGSGDIQASPDNVWAAMVKAALKEQA